MPINNHKYPQCLYIDDDDKGKKQQETTEKHQQTRVTNWSLFSNMGGTRFHPLLLPDSKQKQTHHYQEVSQNEQVPPTSFKGKGTAWTNSSPYIKLFDDFDEENLGKLISCLVGCLNSYIREHPIHFGDPPPWWPKSDAIWWAQLNLPIREGEPPFTDVSDLSKVYMVAVLTSIIKYFRPEGFRKITNQLENLEKLITPREWWILNEALSVEEQYLRASMVNVTGYPSYEAIMARRVRQPDSTSLQFPWKNSIYGANPSMKFFDVSQMNRSSGEMNYSRLIGLNELTTTASKANRGIKRSQENLIEVPNKNKRIGVMPALKTAFTEERNSEAAHNFQQNFSFGLEMYFHNYITCFNQVQQQGGEDHMSMGRSSVENQNVFQKFDSLLPLPTVIDMQLSSGCYSGFDELSKIVLNEPSFSLESITTVDEMDHQIDYLTGFEIEKNSQYDQLRVQIHGNDSFSTMDMSLPQESRVHETSLPEAAITMDEVFENLEKSKGQADQTQQESGEQSDWFGDFSGDSIGERIGDLPEIDIDTMNNPI